MPLIVLITAEGQNLDTFLEEGVSSPYRTAGSRRVMGQAADYSAKEFKVTG